ncbi:MAG TPA: aldehyde dehydrogenase family protein, partial [Bryobacteraceae bacterium]
MATQAAEILKRLGIESENPGAYSDEWIDCAGEELESRSPIDGSLLGTLRMADSEDYNDVVYKASKMFPKWRMVPAPQRGQIVREIGEELRKHKNDLGAIVTLEMGKILSEGRGEVQEMIDIADFAVGLSRQLHGSTMHSERPLHRMYEQWHPLGAIGLITAFNFPVAVWSWNALIALVCGDCVVWKPSLKTPLTAIATQRICAKVLEKHGFAGVLTLVIGKNEEVGERMLIDKRLPLISFTGSTAIGKRVSEIVSERLGRTLLELGGNNGVVAMDDANVDMVVRAALFGAVGTAGQRCTSTRRLFVQKGIAQAVTEKLVAAYERLRIGNPMESDTLVGPLIDEDAVKMMMDGLDRIREAGATVIHGGEKIEGCYVKPAIVKAVAGLKILKEEIFAPILYIVEFDHLQDGILAHNNVPQGLSSSMFTSSVASAETFLSHAGSDCGIANINLGTSGAEIGGAFGGEKDTGGGRESG